MGSMNKAMILGHLGRDAELRYTPGGQPVSNFSVATSEQWTDKAGQRQERTEWHRVTAWGKQAESLDPYLKKGKQVLVEGRIETRKWTDKDGNDRYTTEIVANRITLLGGGEGRGGGRGRARDEQTQDDRNDWSGAQEPPREPVSEISDDDIPF